MQRTGQFFAITSLMLLILGLSLASFLRSSTERSVGWPWSRMDYGIPLDAPCYAVAALFALFAGLYTISNIPFAKGVSQWHFWLSFTGVLLFAIGYGMLAALGSRELQHHETSQGSMAVAAFGLVFGPVAFIVGQLLFVVGLVRAVLETRRH